MRIMGLDLGDKTLGIAISDPTGFLSTGYPTIRFKSRDYASALDQLTKYINEYKVEKIVLGLPLNMDGSEGRQAQASRTFKNLLVERFNLEVILLDERLTTKIGLQNMIYSESSKKKRHDDIDMEAARVILQNYLDKERYNKK